MRLEVTSSNNRVHSSPSTAHSNESDITLKIEKITECLENSVVDLWNLRSLSLSKGGLVNPEIRKKVWPKLVGLYSDDISISTKSSKQPETITVNIQCHKKENTTSMKNWNMIQRDKHRSILSGYLKHSDHNTISEPIDTSTSYDSNLSLPSLCSSKSGSPLSCDSSSSSSSDSDDQPPLNTIDNLAKVILSVVTCDTNDAKPLHYYQGFHDVAALFLSTLNDVNLTSTVLRRIARSHFHLAMESDFSSLLSSVRSVFFPLLRVFDEELFEFLTMAGVDITAIISPWLITWFCHDVADGELSRRLFDVFIVSHPTMPIYFCIAMMSYPRNRIRILSSDRDHASVHMMMMDILNNTYTDDHMGMKGSDKLQDLIDQSILYMEQIPPQALIHFANESNVNFQATTRMNSSACYSLFQDPPDWAVAPTTPKRRLRLRGKKDKQHQLRDYRIVSRQVQTIDKSIIEMTLYKNAKVASGYYGMMNGDFRPQMKKKGYSFSSLMTSTYNAVGLLSRVLIGIEVTTARKRVL